MKSFLSLCEENTDWLRESPRQRSIVIQNTDGDCAVLYYGLNIHKTREGVAVMMEDKTLSLLVYPLNNVWKEILRHETVSEYFAAKQERLSK